MKFSSLYVQSKYEHQFQNMFVKHCFSKVVPIPSRYVACYHSFVTESEIFNFLSVHYRVFAVYPDLKMYTGNFDIEIMVSFRTVFL